MQQNIDFGAFPDDPDADAIRSAFQKVQNNFDELYTASTEGAVTSVNRGAGIDVNNTTGNVIVTANLAQVVVTTTSLSIGQGSNIGTTAVINRSTQTLVLDINPANVFSNSFAAVGGGLANLTGTLTSNSNSQPNLVTATNLTSIGTLVNLAVTSNITAGNVFANSGTIGASTLTGSLTTPAQPNITSTGTLTGLGVNGTITATNITANTGVFTGDGSGLYNISVSAGSRIVNGTSNVTITNAAGNVTTSVGGVANVLVVTSVGANIEGTLTTTGNISAGNMSATTFTGALTGLASSATIAASANTVAGANVSGTVSSATTAGTVTTAAQPNITSTGTLTSLSITGNITSGNANLGNATTSNYFIGDGSLLTGIAAGTSTTAVTVTANAQPNITSTGTLTSLVVTGNITSGNANLGNATTSNYFIGNLYGTANSATTAATLTTNAQPNITSTGTLTSLVVTGNITSGNANLGNLATANFFSGNFYGTANSATNAATVTTNAQPNITSTGTLTSLAVTGDTTSGNAVISNYFIGNGSLLTGVAAGTSTTAVTVTANAQPNITSTGTLSGLTVTATITGNITGSALTATTATTAGTVTSNAQPNITSTGTLTSLVVTGNIQADNANLGNATTSNYFIGNGSLLTGVAAGTSTTAVTVTANAQPNITSTGTLTGLTVTATITGNITGSAATATTAGAVTTNAQPNITSTGTLTSLVVTGNITSGNANLGNLVTANFFSGDGSLLTGVVAGTSTTSVTVTGNAQPNITSTGTLSGLTVSNSTGVVDFTTTANVTLGAVGNLHISGGSSNYFLMTNGSGALTWNNATLVPAAGSNTQVIFNTTGSYSGSSAFTFNNVTNVLSVSNRISATLLTGTVTTNAQPNITELGSLSYLIVTSNGTSTGNINAGNVIVGSGIFSGNGSGLSQISGANVTGFIANAVYANTAGSSTTAASATTAATVTTNAQPNITSTGTLTSLVVTGNIQAGNANLGNLVTANFFSGNGSLLTGLIVSVGSSIVNGSSNVSIVANANVNISAVGNANVVVITGIGATISGTLNVTGNTTLGNIVTANFFSGNGSLLTGLAASSATNASAVLNNVQTTGTYYPAFISATANGNYSHASNTEFSANFANGALIATTFVGALAGAATSATTAGTVTTAAQPNITSVGTLTGLAMGTNKITGLGTPSADTDAATKAYVDNIAQGLDTKASVVAATTANITLSGAQTIDGISVIAGDRILVKNQTAPADNGIYLCAVAGWTRTTDMDTWAEVPGAYTFVETGTINADTGWVCTSNAGGTLGVTSITWAQFSGAGSYSAGTGLTLTGTQFSVNASQTQVTSVGTLGNLTVTGNITSGNANLGNAVTANFFSGSGNNLSNIQGANVSGFVANAVYANLATYATTANAVAGGNVSGIVANATYATSSGTATGLSAILSIASGGTNSSATPTAGTVGYGNGTAHAYTAVGSAGQVLTSNAGSAPYWTTPTTGTVTAVTATAPVSSSGGTTPNISMAQSTTSANGWLSNVDWNTFNNKGSGSVTSVTATGPLSSSGGTTPNISITVANSTVSGYLANADWVTFNAKGSGSVTSVANGAYLTGGTITTSGTLAVNAASANTASTVVARDESGNFNAGTITAASINTTSITTGANTTAGTIIGNWSLSTGSKLNATYADLAEYYAGSHQIESGTVVEFGGEHEVQICNSHMSTLVAGIVTTDPAYLMNAEMDCLYPVAIALQGRVPAKVIGPVKRGDMMVSTNNGCAISCAAPVMGTVLGKALKDFDGATGIIEIMVGRT